MSKPGGSSRLVLGTLPSFLLRTSYLRPEPKPAQESLRQAELLAKTPRQRCLVQLEKVELAIVLLTSAARAWERLGRPLEASRAWVALASHQVGRGSPDAARAALRKAIATREWLPLLSFARSPRDWPELALDWERLAPPGPPWGAAPGGAGRRAARSG